MGPLRESAGARPREEASEATTAERKLNNSPQTVARDSATDLHVRGGVVQMIPHGVRGAPCSLQPPHGLAPLLVERHVAQARAEVVGALHRALEQLLVEAL